MENGFDGAAEGVFAAEESGFVGEGRGFGFRCSIVGASRRGRFEDVECETETLKCAEMVLDICDGVLESRRRT